MTEQELKEKIVGIVYKTIVFQETKNLFGANYQVLSENIADALISEGIGDVSEWKQRAEFARIETENAELRARLEKAVDEKNKWFSVEERLPETDNKNTHDFDVLVYVPKRDDCAQHGIYLGKLSHVNADDGTKNFWGIKTEACDWTIWGWSYFEHPIVTHWKPLPAFPIEAEACLAELKGEKK